MNLTLTSRYVGNIAVIHAAGKLVLGDAVELLDANLKAAFQECPEVVVNLAEVTYVDSSGLGALVRLNTMAQARHKRLALCCLTEKVAQLLKMTNILSLFLVYSTEEAAVTARMAHAQSANALESNGQRLLCVDSSNDMLAFFRSILQAKGHQVFTSNNFPDAALLLKAARVDLVVFGPNPAPCSAGSSIETLSALAPMLPIIVVKDNADAAEMAAKVLEEIAKKAVAS
ncbi:MAG TPA: STAS domain-containing protein [Terriglobales bacterium]|nr:STAS domain-containing protein [Terriglobales bacterium]